MRNEKNDKNENDHIILGLVSNQRTYDIPNPRELQRCRVRGDFACESCSSREAGMEVDI